MCGVYVCNFLGNCLKLRVSSQYISIPFMILVNFEIFVTWHIRIGATPYLTIIPFTWFWIALSIGIVQSAIWYLIYIYGWLYNPNAIYVFIFICYIFIPLWSYNWMHKPLPKVHYLYKFIHISGEETEYGWNNGNTIAVDIEVYTPFPVFIKIRMSKIQSNPPAERSWTEVWQWWSH